MDTIKLFVILASALHCNGVSIQKQLKHIASRRAESQRRSIQTRATARRFGMFGSGTSVILGAPSYANHLPAAEPIIPGHTLMRPAMGMLKSAVKFPHRELEDGSGVYGHIDNLGIRYDGKNERVLYSGFRRTLQDEPISYILMIPHSKKLNLRQKPVYVGLPKDPELKGTDLKKIFRLIMSLRRDQDDEDNNFEDIIRRNSQNAMVTASMEEKNNKTKTFWETQNLFNHITINPDAPEFFELMPQESAEKTRDWWFYHQSDFEEFEES